ncbi:hypothetical protein [Sinosporangium siamense]|uniref:Uncharacterized protein n=1 Tax=Sinosporangium siamense TaxID=1367973 RepID=A0A919RI69_9ACTN|nr:hypothetical protein [Sinosporangium siamense]GII94237.1 hypothetical protein Ssi02_44680 [Sinosporangium siamense]
MNSRHVMADTGFGSITVPAKDEAIKRLSVWDHIRRPEQDTFGPETVASTDMPRTTRPSSCGTTSLASTRESRCVRAPASPGGDVRSHDHGIASVCLSADKEQTCMQMGQMR